MKYMKSLLAFATVALLGSSAWAAPKATHEETIEIGATSQEYTFYYKDTHEDRWWKLVSDPTSNDGSSTAIFNDAMEGKSYRSANHGKDNAVFRFRGEKTGKITWRIYWTSPYGSDPTVIPTDDPSNPGSSAGYPSGSDSWQSKDDYYETYTITVIESTKTKHNGEAQTVEAEKSVTLPDDIKTAWTAKSQGEGVATVTASGDAGVQPVVSGVARGKTEVWVENATDRWVYPVTVWEKTIGSDSINVKPGADNASVTCTADLEDAWTASSADEGIATVSVSGSETSVKPTIHGVAVGQTTVTVQNKYATWTITVNVRDMTQAEIFAEILTDKTGNARVDTTTDDDALYLWYETVGSSSLEIPAGYGAKADYLVVGGGGGGGGGRTMSSGNNRYGYGGNGGTVNEKTDQTLTAGQALKVTVGKGGDAGAGNGTTTTGPGKKGDESSFNGTSSDGGTGGDRGSTNSTDGKGASGSGMTGKTSQITGSVYGAGGPKGNGSAPSTVSANTGNGGGGGTTSGAGAAGGSGIVVIRITAMNVLKDVTVETPPVDVTAKSGTTLGTISLTGGKAVDSNGAQVAGPFAFKDATYALTVADDGKSFDVVFTPTDGATYKTATCKVTVTVTASAKDVITSSNATVTGTDDQPIYTFTSTSAAGSLTIPANYKATIQILAVGGGGGGGYASSTSTRYGNGGDGGQVLGGNNSTITRTVGAGETLNITVGAGGTAGTAAQGGNTNAQPGGSSSVTGGNSFGAEVKANGGSAGGNTQSSTNAKNGTGAGATAGSGTVTGIQSNLRTGSNVTYGEGGAKGSNSNPSAGGDNTGKGGGGARATSSNSSRRSGAAGGSGIVVIKVTSFEALPKPVVNNAIAGTLTYGQALGTIANNRIAATMKNANGQAVSGSFAWDCDTTVKPTVADSGTTEYQAVFTPSDPSAYWTPVTVQLKVTVNPKPVTVTADDKEKLVNNPTPALTYPQPTGLVGSDTITGELTWDGQETVGGHDIVQADDWASANPNYDITFMKGTLTIKAGKVTVNGKGYDNVTDAFNDLLASKGSATFNDTGIVYDGMTFQRGATLTVADDESWTVTNNGGTSLIATKIPGKMNLTVDGTLELSGDIFVAPAGEDDTVVTVTNFMLDASITVGKESNGATDAMAYLSFNHFENENQAEYRITLTTNGVVRSLNATKLVIADVFAAAPADYKIAETAIEGGWEYTLAPISTFAITVEIDGEYVTDVTMDGESAVGTVRLPEGTTAVTLTLEADQTILTIPVYKVTTNGATTVTAKTASYAVADGAVLSFTAEEAEFDDDATDEETKQAIKDAIDDGPAHDDAVAKIEKVTGDGEGQVPAKELATWITESEVSSAEIAESDYVAASANLGADGLIDEDDAEIGCSNATVKASEDAANLVLMINLKPNENAESEPITSEGVAKYIQVSDGMDSDFEPIDPDRVTVDDDEVTIEPDSAKEKEFFKVVLVKDDGTASKVESQVIAIATRTTTGVAAGKKVREAVSVTWTDVDGSPIPLQKVVSKDAVTEGDLLYAWNAATKVYDCWMLSGTKVWEPQTTVRMSGEEVTENKPSTDRTFALGEVIWLERQDSSKPVHLYGGVDEDAELPEINEGMNLLSAPNFEAVDLDVTYKAGVAVEGDEVTLPIPDKSPKTFTFKDGAWGYQGFIKVGDKGIKPGRVTATPDEKMLIPAGHGFWYKRQAKAE